jgi:hypothetical protein
MWAAGSQQGSSEHQRRFVLGCRLLPVRQGQGRWCRPSGLALVLREKEKKTRECQASVRALVCKSLSLSKRHVRLLPRLLCHTPRSRRFKASHVS